MFTQSLIHNKNYRYKNGDAFLYLITFQESVNIPHSWNVFGNERLKTGLDFNCLRGITDYVIEKLFDF